MATYVKREDFENYSEGWVTTDPDALERLLLRAEKDIDRIVIPVEVLTNSVQGIALSGTTGGTFTAGLVWNSVSYTSNINWNATGQDVLTGLLNMADQYGHLVPPGAWTIPESSYYSQPWAFGPLPAVGVVLEAANNFGGQLLKALTIDTTNLMGTSPDAIVTVLVGGGLKINPYLLSAKDADVLRQATCAQAEYRNEMGEKFFRRAQWREVEGPEFQTRGRLPLIGPKVMREFANSDLLQRGARARPGTTKGMATAYMPVGGTPIPDDWRGI